MRAQSRVVLVSSVLFTLALLCSIPGALGGAWTWRRSMIQVSEQAWLSNWLAPIGFASLAIIFIGLIVTWTGYLQRNRWAWCVMAIIVLLWAFPLMILPLLQFTVVSSMTEWFWTAINQPGPHREFGRGVLTFAMMVIALLLPIKSFFLASDRSE